MAKANSFDIVSRVNRDEIHNAVNLANKEISVRYDFKGSDSKITFEQDVIKIITDDEYKIKSIIDVLNQKLIRRRVSIKSIKYGTSEPALGGRVRLSADIIEGIDKDKAREIMKLIRNNQPKVNVRIQGEELRVSAVSKDALQQVIKTLKNKDFKQPLQFVNFR